MFQGWTSDGASNREEEQDLSSSENKKNFKKRTQYHYFCTAVLGKKHDSKMEHFLDTHPVYCPTYPKLPAHMEGSTFGAAEKNKPIHSCFT